MTRVLGTILLASLAGCGYVGPPLPPALHVPKPVTDLSAEVIGDRIVIRFTRPVLTTEELPAELRAITLYAGERRYQVPIDATEFPLPAADFVGQQVVLRLRTTGRAGRESDWSNDRSLTVVASLATPANVTFKNAPEAISIEWSGNAPRYRVLRVAEGKPQPLAETESAAYVDRSIVMGTRYEYVIVGLAGESQQSLPSARAAFTPADVFAPEIPSGLTAVASGVSVDLSWSRSADADLAGYNIFRAVGQGPLEPLAQRVLAPAYTDTRVAAGQRYRYAVSAIDMAGNESMRSTEQGVQVE